MTKDCFINAQYLAQLYGHHHRDKTRMLYTDEYTRTDNNLDKTALLMSPSITPIYQNSPAFRLFAFNQREGNLHNYTQYYMDLTLSNCKKIEHFLVCLLYLYVLF